MDKPGSKDVAFCSSEHQADSHLRTTCEENYVRQRNIDTCNVARETCTTMKGNVFVMNRHDYFCRLAEPFSVMEELVRPEPDDMYAIARAPST